MQSTIRYILLPDATVQADITSHERWQNKKGIFVGAIRTKGDKEVDHCHCEERVFERRSNLNFQDSDNFRDFRLLRSLRSLAMTLLKTTVPTCVSSLRQRQVVRMSEPGHYRRAADAAARASWAGGIR